MSDEFETFDEGFEQEPKKSNRNLIIGIVAFVLLCCCCSTVAFGWVYGDAILEAINSLGLQFPVGPALL